MGNNLSSRLFPHAIYSYHGSLAVVYFLFFFMLIFSNSFGPLDRGTFPAVPVR